MFVTKPDFDDGDVVLRTPDGTRFRVHRAILSSASPFFKDLFSLPQPLSKPDACSDGELHPVLDILERTELVDAVLRVVYPFAEPPITTIDDLSELLQVASKYDLVSVFARLSKHVISPSPKWGPHGSLRAFALACQYQEDLPPDTLALAAHNTLSSGLLGCSSSLPREFKQIPATAYHQLLLLHRKRGTEAVKVIREVDLTVETDLRCAQCSAPGIGYMHVSGIGQPRWWVDWSKRAEIELLVSPTTDHIFSMAFLAESARNGCPKCAASLLESHAFLQRLRAKIDALPDIM